MISWILAVLGFVYGLVLHDSEAGVILALLGFFIGRWFEKRSAQASAPTQARTSLAAELQQLKLRVSQLEQEVAALKGVQSPLPDSSASATVDIVAGAIPTAELRAAPMMGREVTADESIAQEKPAPIQTPSAPLTRAQAPRINWFNKALSASQTWLFGGNTVARLGMIILFFGVGFLLKFAADNQMLPIQLRLAGLSLGAAAIFLVGWRLRDARRSYALILQGGALGLLYFTIYGALKLYHLLPAQLAFALLVLLGVAAAVLAIRQDASPLAVTGLMGGFLAPILTSDGSGNFVLLFTYYSILNAGIFTVAWFKAWRSLNLLGFLFTYALTVLWMLFDYRAEMRGSMQPFIVIFWLFYAGISTQYALLRSHSLRSIVDGSLVFGTPIVTLALQARLMQGIEYGLCFSALIGAVFYLALALWLHRRRDEKLKLFFETQLALGVLLATLAIPLAFDGNVTAAMWAIEGAGLVWVSLRQHKLSALTFGLLLQFAAGLAVLSSSPYYTTIPVLNGVYLADAMVALAGLFCAWQLHEHQPEWRHKNALCQAGWLLGAWGLLWWGYGNWHEALRFLSDEAIQNASLVLCVATAAVFQQWYLRQIWRNARVIALALGPVLLFLALKFYPLYPHYFSLWAWPLALVGLFGLLYQQDQSNLVSETWQHIVAAWLSWGILINELYYLSNQQIHDHVSALAAFAILASASIAIVQYVRWPVKAHWRAYWVYGSAPAAAILYCWGFYTALSGGHSALPLLNGLDLAQIAVFAALIFWLRLVLRELNVSSVPQAVYAALGGAAFVWLNAMLLRTLHHAQQIAYTFDALTHSTVVQMSLSIFWTLLALALMFAATRKSVRTLWLVGASLLAIVIGKLFMIDLSHISGIERIISFLGVGILLLVIGYLAPIPPRQTDALH